MLEIYVLFFYIPRKIRSLAKPRGQSVAAWSLIAMGAWITAEIITLFLILLLMTLSRDLADSGLFMFSTWVISFLAAAGAVNLVFRRLRRMPVRQTDEASWL